MVKSGETAIFTYNADGLRVKKVCTTTGTTNYTLHGKNLVHLSNNGNDLHFFYDAQNRPAVVVFNGTAYGYMHNLQGDVIAIVNSAGTKVVEYAYNAWGKPISKTGSLASNLGTLNPFRYRGYVYDEETGLYYLRSRYYDTEWLRFLNADTLLLHNFNLFCYCMQQPINRVDPNGTDFFECIWDEMSNRSLFSPMHLGAVATAYKGNTSGVWDPNGVWTRAMTEEERWINSDNNNELINATCDLNKPGSPQYQPNANGLYGTKGKNVRVLPGSVEDAKNFFEAMTYGKYVYDKKTQYDGINRYMSPHGNVIYRPNS